ncbi:hypothetical protein LAZ67_1003339 [Cordylochernes scorpioides]|uniref:Integrase catalytic domain-containing protein n=1 Tax=Cordylochernes scorpioides TaxID=51811 RepID=A0ABY6JY88_9ARAC|nr:hypothetical protein LAZ67_1003339 [Cordylochernes scorpioides]
MLFKKNKFIYRRDQCCALAHKFGKSYSPEEEFHRKAIFNENLEEIIKHNLDYDLGLKSYRLGLNKFSDMSFEEFEDKYTGYKKTSKHNLGEPMEIPEEMDLPDSLDYRTKGVVTPVKAQGHCGSCWAFSATGAIEGQYALETGKLISLSEQQLVDCTLRHNGCKGGDQEVAFSYIRRVGGIESEEDYPYEARYHQHCNFRKKKVVVTVKAFRNMPSTDELALQKALVKYGPIAISIQATKHLKYYSSGVLDDTTCKNANSPIALNHAVLLVGYGTENGQDYWLIKNSWGPEYGDGGYVKMETKLNQNLRFNIKDYTTLRMDRPGKFGGGLAVLIKTLEIKFKEIAYNQSLIETLSEASSDIAIILGDFNAERPTWGSPVQDNKDNGRQFVSGEFEQFTKMNGIRHTKTSPYNPSTNGLAERYVREFKNLLRKNNGKDDLETNLQSFLFAHRAFPQTVIKEFPGGTANEEKFKIKILDFNTKMGNPREVFHEAVRRQEQFTTGFEVYFRNYATGPKR